MAEAIPQPVPAKNYLLVTLLGSFWNVLQFIISFLVATSVSVILSRYLGAENYGLMAYLSWFSSVILLVFNFGILTTVQTWIPKYFFTGEMPRAAFVARQLFRFQFLVILGGLVVVVPLIFVWHNFVSFPPREFTQLMLVNLLPMSASILNIFLSTLLASLQRFKQAVLIYITGQLLTLASVIIVVTLKMHILGLLVLLGITNVLMLLLFLRYSRDILRHMISEWRGASQTKKIISFSGWAYLNLILSAVIWDKSEFFFLGIYEGGKALAVYGIAYSLSTMTTAMLDPVISVFTTILSELVAKKDWGRIHLIIRLCAKYLSLVLLPLVSLTYALSPYIVQSVYGKEFLFVATIFPVLFLSVSLNKIFSPVWSIPQYLHDLRSIVIRNIFIALLNIALSILLISRYGVWGAVIANVATQITAVTYFGGFVRRYNIHIFTPGFFKVFSLNLALFVGVFLTVQHQFTITKIFLVSLAWMLGYAVFAYLKLINREDRQLLSNSILTIKNRSISS